MSIVPVRMDRVTLCLFNLICQTKEEIAELERDICGLEEDLRAKEAPLKLVHTRLENRTMRPGVDLCQDQVYPSIHPSIHKSIFLLAYRGQKAGNMLDLMSTHCRVRTPTTCQGVSIDSHRLCGCVGAVWAAG